MDDREAELDRIRETLRICIDRSTLRAVAVQVGMSPTGLQEFVRGGAKAYGPTREKVRAWFYRRAGMDALTPSDAAVVLRRLVVTLPDPDKGVVSLLDALESL